jgi:ABC-2 type transport system permease protein
MGIPELQMQTYEKDKAQVVNGFMGIAVLYGDKKELMPVVQNINNLEYDLTQAILKVGRKENPRIGVLKTDTVPSIPPQLRDRMPQGTPDFREKYKQLFDNLEKNYTVDIVETKDIKPIDTSLKSLLIPGGTDFSNRTLFEIDQFFMKGGNLIVLADAIAVNFQYGAMASPQSPGILRLVEHYGAKVENSLICDAACGQVQIPQKVGPFQMNVAVNYPYFVRAIREGLNKDNPAVSTLGELVFPWPSPVTLLVPEAVAGSKNPGDTNAVKGTVLIKSSEKSWVVAGNFDLNPQQKWNAPAEGFKQSNLAVALSGNFTSFFTGKPIPPVKDPVPGDTSKILTNTDDQNRTIVTKNKNKNLVVVGESDFITPQFGMPGNLTFVLNLVDWLSTDNNLISVRSRTMADRTLSKDNLKEGSSKPMIIRYTNILLMPLLVICFGLFIFLKRREVVAAVPTDKKEEKVS